jgi:hypothetical protein
VWNTASQSRRPRESGNGNSGSATGSTGKIETRIDLLAIRRVQLRIDRELKNATRYQPSQVAAIRNYGSADRQRPLI